jgi:hypothetical protein
MKDPRVPVNENMGSGTGIGTFTPTCNVNVQLSMAKNWLKFRKVAVYQKIQGFHGGKKFSSPRVKNMKLLYFLCSRLQHK